MLLCLQKADEYLFGLGYNKFHHGGYLLFSKIGDCFSSHSLDEPLLGLTHCLRIMTMILPLRIRRHIGIVSLRGGGLELEVELICEKGGGTRSSLLKESLLSPIGLSEHLFITLADAFTALHLIVFATVTAPLLYSKLQILVRFKSAYSLVLKSTVQV